MKKETNTPVIVDGMDIDKMTRHDLEALIIVHGLAISFNEQMTDEELREAIASSQQSEQSKNEEYAKEKLEKAEEIAKRSGVKEVFVNSKDEFFTVLNYALLSENQDAGKVQTFDFSKSNK